MTTQNKIVLFEYDTPIDLEYLLNYEAGIWFFTLVNTVTTVTDTHFPGAYYKYQNDDYYIVKSLKIAGLNLSITISLADCRVTNNSFFYDTTTSNIFVNYNYFDPVEDDNIFYGGAIGYSKMPNNEGLPYFTDYYYPPLLISVTGLKKSIDPLFFGLLKYSSGSATLINASGEFDNWRALNLYGQAGRIMVGDVNSDYSTFDTVFEGFIADDSRDFDEFKVELEDPRKALTQPVASNTLNKTDWPYLSDSNVNAVKPVAYGKIKRAAAICLNEDETTPSYYTFLICDTTYNAVSSLDAIYVDGVLTAITGTANLTAGTFTMTFASVIDLLSDVQVNFTMPIVNGVAIIKDLMYQYDGKSYVASFWDLTEVAAALAISRNTSLYINSGDRKLSEAIESVCIDIDGRFFTKNDGLYTIRLYDANRTPLITEIKDEDWLNEPQITNNGSEYLSSAIIKYYPSQEGGKTLTYENTSYRDYVFGIYKKYKSDSFTTNLYELTAAQAKSETIMGISKNVQDIVKRNTIWEYFGIEPGDFINCSPATRLSDAEDFNTYEVLAIENNVDKFEIVLSLRYIKDALHKVYASIDDNTNVAINDNNNFALVGRVS